MPPSNPANVADWITAVAGIFAAVGTVGAVIVALWQTRAHARRRLDVSCSLAIMVPDADPIDVLALRGTNIGFRPIKLTGAYLLTDDNRHVISPFVRPNVFQTFIDGTLPAVLDDGESVDVYWYADKLEEAKRTEGFAAYYAAFFRDSQGNSYHACYPGVTSRRAWVWRRGPKRTTKYVIPSERRRGRFRLLSKNPDDYR